jgi:hypothetical protein
MSKLDKKKHTKHEHVNKYAEGQRGKGKRDNK